jgi:hypothetical protein
MSRYVSDVTLAMRPCTCEQVCHHALLRDAHGCRKLAPISLSVVILARAGIDLEPTVGQVHSLVSMLVADHEIIVVLAVDPNAGTSRAWAQRHLENVGPRGSVYFLVQEVDEHTAAWMGIENARGDFVAVLDAASDDVGYLPEMLDQAKRGADLVFARNRSGAPPRLTRQVTLALLARLCESFDLMPVQVEAPHYRILSKHVVSFLQHDPNPARAYRRLVWTNRFARVDLWYGSSTRSRPALRGAEKVQRGMRRAATTIGNRLWSLRGRETTIHDYAARNETPYVVQLPAIKAGSFSIAPELLIDARCHYYPANPSIVRLGERTRVNVRLVNYEKTKGGFKIAADGVTRTRNLTFEWDVRSERADLPRDTGGVPSSWPQQTSIRGLEDQRFVVHEGKLWFSACCSQVPLAEGRCCMVLGRMNERFDTIDHLVPFHYAGAREAEKNWLLWSFEGRLLVIYGYHPLTILEVDPTSGKTQIFRQHPADFTARRFRGSAGPLPIPERPGNWLALVHEVAFSWAGPVYTHRWIELSPDAGILAYSRPFLFDHVGIEYAAGLVDNGDGSLTVTYGVEDCDARWVLIDRASVLKSLRAAFRESSAAVQVDLPRQPLELARAGA